MVAYKGMSLIKFTGNGKPASRNCSPQRVETNCDRRGRTYYSPSLRRMSSSVRSVLRSMVMYRDVPRTTSAYTMQQIQVTSHSVGEWIAAQSRRAKASVIPLTTMPGRSFTFVSVSADAPNPDVTGAHDAFHRTLLDVCDTDVAAAHDRQACRRGAAADVDVAAALDGRRERRHGAALDLDVTRTLNLRHHGAVDLLDADVAGTLNGELRTGDATGVHVVALHTCRERTVRVADDDVAEHAVGVDGSTLRHLDGDLDSVLAATASGDHGRHVATSEDVAHDGTATDDNAAAGDDRTTAPGLDDGAPAATDDSHATAGRTGAVTLDDERAALDVGADGLDLVGGAGDGVLDAAVAVRVHLDVGDDATDFEGRGGNPLRAFGDFLGVAAGVRATDVDVAGTDAVHLAGADIAPAAIGEGDAGVDDRRHLLVGIDRLAVDVGDECHDVLPVESRGMDWRYIPFLGTVVYIITILFKCQCCHPCFYAFIPSKLTYLTQTQNLSSNRIGISC